MKSATKFLCVKTFSSRVVVYQFPTSWCIDVGGKRNNLIFSLKVIHPFNKGRFRRSASAVRVSKNIQF